MPHNKPLQGSLNSGVAAVATPWTAALGAHVPDRKPIKKKHEQFHINNFVEWLNATYRCNYKIIAETEPPEAVIQSKTKTSWIEISTAFLDVGYAKDVMSYVTPGEKHVSVSGKLYVGPDQLAAESFVDVVKKKLEKRSYLPIAKKYGPGYLVVPIHNPLFTKETLAYMKAEWEKAQINDLGCFRSVRISYQPIVGITVQPHWVFQKWPKKR